MIPPFLFQIIYGITKPPIQTLPPEVPVVVVAQFHKPACLPYRNSKDAMYVCCAEKISIDRQHPNLSSEQPGRGESNENSLFKFILICLFVRFSVHGIN